MGLKEMKCYVHWRAVAQSAVQWPILMNILRDRQLIIR